MKSLAVVSGLLAAWISIASGAPLSIVLPDETAVLKPSGLPGYALASQKCYMCHSADYISLQPPGMSVSQWTAEVGKMKHAYGAPLNDEDVKQIGEYLAATYGESRAADAR